MSIEEYAKQLGSNSGIGHDPTECGAQTQGGTAWGGSYPPPVEYVCPRCGYCPHCGRGGYTPSQPYTPIPMYGPAYIGDYPKYQITCCNSTNSSR